MQNLALEEAFEPVVRQKRKDQKAEFVLAWGKKNQPFNR